jgi:anti-anti-sigma factor
VALELCPCAPAERQVVVVRLCGEHDLASAGEVGTRLAEAQTLGLTVVDVSACVFLDSSIIACLIAVRRAQGVLAVVLPPASNAVERALLVTGVTDILTCHHTLREAIDATLASTADRPA